LTLRAKGVNTARIRGAARRREISMRGLSPALFACGFSGFHAGCAGVRATKTPAKTKTTAKTV
jgi:hypothetical protein